MTHTVAAESLTIHPAIEWLVTPANLRFYAAEEDRLRASNEIPTVSVWDGSVVGEFVQYRICCAIKRKVRPSEIPLANLDEAITHVCYQELGRNDLNAFMRRYLVGRLYGALRNEARHVSEHRIFQQLGIRTGTYYRYRCIARAFDCLFDSYPLDALKIRRGRAPFSFPAAKHYLGVLSGKVRVDPTPSEESFKVPPLREKPKFSPQIKQMPKTNPLSLLQTLKFTMASWTPVVDKAIEGSSFEEVPQDLKQCLQEIARLHLESVTHLLEHLEET